MSIVAVCQLTIVIKDVIIIISKFVIMLSLKIPCALHYIVKY